MKERAFFTLGLTGGIGSGKSTVAGMLAARGAGVIDADAISRQSTAAGGAAIAPIAQAFGARIIGADGALDRAAMRELIYRDGQARARLEAIMHPLVYAEMARQTAAARQAGYRLLALDIPLLAEGPARWRGQLDRIVVVDCPPETQIARVMARGGLAREDVARIIAAQATPAQRRAVADHVIDNGPQVTLAALAAQVDRLIGGLPGS
ncbi:MAG: dephospho-CoA kinase [Burkholderiaceae bacterium]|jgi:dephospho-CoA kinase|nr:dephospho-CoA kinase [Burkholderiaceae bacterium]